MEELGAFGEATVTGIGPCPPIKPGTGAVVTGKFAHEADENSKVVRLRLEGQAEETGVTANHPCWSIDRGDFVPVGDLAQGELVSTDDGPRRVVAITPDPNYRGYLYNVETTEHVYLAGELGTLVHNSCLPKINIGPSGKLSTQKFLEKHWDKATFGNIRKSVDYHVFKHGKGLSDVQYTQSALKAFKNPTATKTKAFDIQGRPAIKVDAIEGRGLFTPSGRIIWFHPIL